MYECLIGYPPFYADEPMVTCRKIVNWKKTLVFPPEAHLSKEAEDIIRKLVCDVNSRLTFDEIKKHAFFESVDWSNISTSTPPIVPEVTSPTDIRNFDKFEEIGPKPADQDESKVRLAVNRSTPDPNNMQFLGYTFKRYDDKRPDLASMFGEEEEQ
eukprot:TRINITY_DN1228_c0_g1_i1.p1 TRINITY_DN1228_c0_g1~~TRINITY_DN1228_c0_g1_i1.p1  ORF type:complete len:156 (+),score=36.21 TRINITY_DN1228_c0_g1_i1:774-1241(+)